MINSDVARRADLLPHYRAAEMVRIDEANERMQRNLAAIQATFDRHHRVDSRALHSEIG